MYGQTINKDTDSEDQEPNHSHMESWSVYRPCPPFRPCMDRKRMARVAYTRTRSSDKSKSDDSDNSFGKSKENASSLDAQASQQIGVFGFTTDTCKKSCLKSNCGMRAHPSSRNSRRSNVLCINPI